MEGSPSKTNPVLKWNHTVVLGRELVSEVGKFWDFFNCFTVDQGFPTFFAPRPPKTSEKFRKILYWILITFNTLMPSLLNLFENTKKKHQVFITWNSKTFNAKIALWLHRWVDAFLYEALLLVQSDPHVRSNVQAGPPLCLYDHRRLEVCCLAEKSCNEGKHKRQGFFNQIGKLAVAYDI